MYNVFSDLYIKSNNKDFRDGLEIVKPVNDWACTGFPFQKLSPIVGLNAAF